MTPVFGGIILAAGESRRMGSNKLVMDFNGKPMIAAVTEIVANSGVDEVLVITGAFRTEVQNALSGKDVKFLHNPSYPEGMISSIRCGIRHLNGDIRAVLIFLGDQPMIPSRIPRLMMEEFRRNGHRIIIPVHKKQRGHPLLLDAAFRDEIMALDAPDGLRSFLKKNASLIYELPTDVPEILRDIDFPEEYQKEIS